jgi:hypothetical protein
MSNLLTLKQVLCFLLNKQAINSTTVLSTFKTSIYKPYKINTLPRLIDNDLLYINYQIE